MGTPLKNPPVYLTLAQVRFNPVLKLADFLPAIQESFRQAGYPDFNRQQVISIQFTAQDGQPPAPTPVPQERFQLGNVEKTHTFILDGQSLTLQSTNYGQFETFSACFLEGLEIVHDAVKLAFTERVGLRYLDRVQWWCVEFSASTCVPVQRKTPNTTAAQKQTNRMRESS